MLEIPDRPFFYAFMALVVILWARAERLHRRDPLYLQEQERLRALPPGHFLRRAAPWVWTAVFALLAATIGGALWIAFPHAPRDPAPPGYPDAVTVIERCCGWSLTWAPRTPTRGG